MIMKATEDERTRLTVIIAGYKDEVEDMPIFDVQNMIVQSLHYSLAVR